MTAKAGGRGTASLVLTIQRALPEHRILPPVLVIGLGPVTLWQQKRLLLNCVLVAVYGNILRAAKLAALGAAVSGSGAALSRLRR